MTAALQLTERALPALATLPEIHLNHGNVLRSAGRAAEAVASYRRAITLEPDHGMAHNNLARALIDMGAPGEALGSAGRAAELIPDFAGAHANHAGALLGLRRFAEAEAALRRALAIAPDEAGLHLDLGCALHQQKRLDEAVVAYRRVLEMRPDFWEAHNNLGCVLTDLKRPDEATVCFAAALRLAPDKAATLHNLGKALRDQHRLGAAVKCFRQAVALSPDLAEARLEARARTGQNANTGWGGDRARTLRATARPRDDRMVLGAPANVRLGRLQRGGGGRTTKGGHSDFFAAGNEVEPRRAARLRAPGGRGDGFAQTVGTAAPPNQAGRTFAHRLCIGKFQGSCGSVSDIGPDRAARQAGVRDYSAIPRVQTMAARIGRASSPRSIASSKSRALRIAMRR